MSASQQRLDFSFYEFPLERFSEVVPGMLGQIKAFAKETGFKPNGELDRVHYVIVVDE